MYTVKCASLLKCLYRKYVNITYILPTWWIEEIEVILIIYLYEFDNSFWGYIEAHTILYCMTKHNTSLQYSTHSQLNFIKIMCIWIISI